MRTPTEFQLEQLAHVYDPAYSRQYYLRTRELKGRKKGSAKTHVYEDGSRSTEAEFRKKTMWRDPRTGKTAEQIHRDAVAKQKKEIGEQIDRLQGKLGKLEALIRKKIREENSEDRESKAKKERARKEADKPKTAAEKAEAARENEKYRDKNQQKLKNKAKSDSKSDDSPAKTSKSSKGASVSDLKALATKVKGKIAVAKQKLAAL